MFDPVAALEAAGVSDFSIDYNTQTIRLEGMGKLADYLGIVEGDFVIYRRWALVQSSVAECLLCDRRRTL